MTGFFKHEPRLRKRGFTLGIVLLLVLGQSLTAAHLHAGEPAEPLCAICHLSGGQNMACDSAAPNELSQEPAARPLQLRPQPSVATAPRHAARPRAPPST